jgi:hypothetical protein
MEAVEMGSRWTLGSQGQTKWHSVQPVVPVRTGHAGEDWSVILTLQRQRDPLVF